MNRYDDQRRGRARGWVLGWVLGLVAVLGAAGFTAPAGAADDTETPASTTFRAATFNILGASHTRSGRRGDPYQVRMRRTIRLINDHGFEIVGLQEFQLPQYEMFINRTAGAWGVYPGVKEGRRPVQNSIIWRKAQWQRVSAHLYRIPYFSGTMVAQPYVLLQNKVTGQEVWVINTHNVADSRGPAQRWRDQAIEIEIELANQLAATGKPIVFTGDFNDRADAFCPLTSRAPLKAVNGGGWVGGVCQPPRNSRIDWIFISLSLAPSNYTVLESAFVDSITDHPVIYTDITAP